MEIRSLFDRVTRTNPVSVNEFLDAYNDIVSELCAKFGDKYVLFKGAVRTDAVKIDSPDTVMDVYAPAIRSGVIWKIAHDNDQYSLYQKLSDEAYKNVHMTRAYGKVINIRRTNEPYPVIIGGERGEINVPVDDHCKGTP